MPPRNPPQIENDMLPPEQIPQQPAPAAAQQSSQRDQPRDAIRATVETRAPTRRRVVDADADPFYFDRSIIPSGWDYQWCVKTVLGEEMVEQQLTMRQAGWTHVPASRHPEMTIDAHLNPNGPILRRGQMLMERPMELTEEARIEDHTRARQQRRDKEEALGVAPAGQLPRVQPTINRTFEPAPQAIPDK